MAKKGGALPAFEELELIRSEGGVPVERFVARIGVPRSTWYYWRTGHLRGRPVRRWPAPVVDAVAARTIETAHKYTAWGHRKIWAMLRADGVAVSVSSVERAMRRADLLQPRRYLAERRALACAEHHQEDGSRRLKAARKIRQCGPSRRGPQNIGSLLDRVTAST